MKRKLGLITLVVMMVSCLLFNQTIIHGANYAMYYNLSQATDITTTSATIEGELIRGAKTDDGITLPGYAFSLIVTDLKTNKIVQSFFLGSSESKFIKSISGLTPNTEYSCTVEGGVSISPVEGTPKEVTFKTLGSKPTLLMGDTNNDNEINSTDYSLLKRYMLSVSFGSRDDEYITGDLNGDEVIDSTDLALLKRYVLGIIFEFPIKRMLDAWTPHVINNADFELVEVTEGNYEAIIKITFPDSGYAIEYDDKVTSTINKGPNSNIYTGTINTEIAFVKKWLGGSATVMTTKELKYPLGKLPVGDYKFNFSANGFNKTIRFYIDSFTEQWLPYTLKEQQVNFKIEKNKDNTYDAVVNLEFTSSGYRVEYDNSVVVLATFAPDPDGANCIYQTKPAKVEYFTGPALTVMTTKQLRYPLGTLMNGKYKFNFVSNDFSKTFTFDVKDSSTETWEPYTLQNEPVEVSSNITSDGKAQIVFGITFPNAGYKVEYEDKVAYAGMVLPDGGTKISCIPAGDPKFYKYSGPSAQVITKLYVKYTVAGSGKYTFRFMGKSYDVDIKPPQTGTWEPYKLQNEPVEVYSEKNSEGKAQAVFCVTFPNSGYKAEYEDQLAYAGIVRPDGTSYVSIKPAVLEFYKYTGASDQVENKVYLKFTLPGTGKYTINFFGKEYVFDAK